MTKLTQSERQRMAREYETRRTRDETALDIAVRWRVHPAYVTMVAKKAREGVYAAQEAARRKRDVRTKKVLNKLRAEQERAAERRRKRKTRQTGILRDYARGLPIAEIAQKYDCHQSYPAKLAKRAGISRRAKGKRKRDSSKPSKTRLKTTRPLKRRASVVRRSHPAMTWVERTS